MSILARPTVLDEPHHDGSDPYVDDNGALRVHVPREVDVVALRYVEDG